MSEKKRKHKTGDDEQPRKKRAADTTAQSLKISFIKDVGGWAPVIATTPGLSLDTNIPLQAYKRTRDESEQRHVGAGRSALSTSELLLHSSAHPKLDYIAREEQSTGADSLLKHYIGAFDPKTGDLQLVEARKLVVRGVLRSAAIQTTPNATADKQSTDLSARSILGQTFGTRKSQKAIRALTENAISSPSTFSQSHTLNPLASAVIESMSQSTTIPSREELQSLVDESKPCPRPNLEAKSPTDVYPVEDLVGGVEILMGVNVRTWQDAVTAEEDVKTSSRFVSSRLRRVVRTGDVKKLKALRFLLLLLDWNGCLKAGSRGSKKLPPREDVRNAVGTEVGEGSLEGVRRKFAAETTLNKWAIDNLMTHICALALTIDSYEVDMYDLREDLRLEAKQMSQYFKELGCRISAPTEAERTKMKITAKEGSVHKIARLRLPLEFPKVRAMTAQRRK